MSLPRLEGPSSPADLAVLVLHISMCRWSASGSNLQQPHGLEAERRDTKPLDKRSVSGVLVGCIALMALVTPSMAADVRQVTGSHLAPGPQDGLEQPFEPTTADQRCTELPKAMWGRWRDAEGRREINLRSNALIKYRHAIGIHPIGAYRGEIFQVFACSGSAYAARVPAPGGPTVRFFELTGGRLKVTLPSHEVEGRATFITEVWGRPPAPGPEASWVDRAAVLLERAIEREPHFVATAELALALATWPPGRAVIKDSYVLRPDNFLDLVVRFDLGHSSVCWTALFDSLGMVRVGMGPCFSGPQGPVERGDARQAALLTPWIDHVVRPVLDE